MSSETEGTWAALQRRTDDAFKGLKALMAATNDLSMIRAGSAEAVTGLKQDISSKIESVQSDYFGVLRDFAVPIVSIVSLFDGIPNLELYIPHQDNIDKAVIRLVEASHKAVIRTDEKREKDLVEAFSKFVRFSAETKRYNPFSPALDLFFGLGLVQGYLYGDSKAVPEEKKALLDKEKSELYVCLSRPKIISISGVPIKVYSPISIRDYGIRLGYADDQLEATRTFLETRRLRR